MPAKAIVRIDNASLIVLYAFLVFRGFVDCTPFPCNHRFKFYEPRIARIETLTDLDRPPNSKQDSAQNSGFVMRRRGSLCGAALCAARTVISTRKNSRPVHISRPPYRTLIR